MVRDVIVCEVLCFLANNFDKLTSSQLKPVLVNFYKEEELVCAKDILFKDVANAAQNNACDTDLPRLPKRQGPNKCKQTVEDLLTLCVIVDERKLNEEIPMYVAANLLRIPFINADFMNVANMAQKVETFEQKLLVLEQRVAQPSSLQTVESVVVMDHSLDKCRDNALNTQHCSRIDEKETHDDGSWTTVTRGKRKQSRDLTSEHTSEQSSQSFHAASVTVPSVRGKQRVFGTRNAEENSKVKSGIQLVQKSVFHVDNLDVNCTAALLNDYLLAHDIQVISCYEAKSWMKSDEERNNVTAFRVCVPALQRQRIFNSELWDKGVIVRPWQFKRTHNGEQS